MMITKLLCKKQHSAFLAADLPFCVIFVTFLFRVFVVCL